ncbi:MAG: hypothetical protein HY019_00695 [Aquabacterium sp.]|uniref:hypothetical protein n=1 Tax=Aquabacterium sp. TaxID=1872578 RepID=UPI0025BA3D64|nr:hypothetical protein [Aquabacterium sp.]MBI3380497.1 hypothetical protein [Aquabacterium sp.]
MTVAPPFPVRLTQVVAPGLMEAHVHFVAPHAVTPETMQALAGLASAFAVFGHWGGFAGSRVKPGPGGFTLTSLVPAADGSWPLRFTDVHADPGVLGVLLKALSRFSLDLSTIEAVHCVADEAFDAQGNAPSSLAPPPFPVEDWREGNRSMVLEIELAEPTTPESRRLVSEVWAAWATLGQLGAFSADDTGLASAQVLVTEPPLSLEGEMRFFHERLRMSRAGTQCLVNALHGLHGRAVHIEGVVLA